MIQPHVYWTLTSSLVWIIGLYTNVPTGGVVDDTQRAWLIEELRAVPEDAAAIVALHHTPYSADAHHGSAKDMAKLLDDAFTESGRSADLVLSGHVHNYQRFTRTLKDRQIPYLVAGGSGYWHLHLVGKVNGAKPMLPLSATGSNGENLQLESFADDRHGFLTLKVTKTRIEGPLHHRAAPSRILVKRARNRRRHVHRRSPRPHRHDDNVTASAKPDD